MNSNYIEKDFIPHDQNYRQQTLLKNKEDVLENKDTYIDEGLDRSANNRAIDSSNKISQNKVDENKHLVELEEKKDINPENIEVRTENITSPEADTDIGSSVIKGESIDNQETSPITDPNIIQERVTTHESNSKIWIKDLINYNVNIFFLQSSLTF